MTLQSLRLPALLRSLTPTLLGLLKVTIGRISGLLLLVAMLFPSVSHATSDTTTVSVNFVRGFIGEYTNNAHHPVTIQTFPTLVIQSVTLSQVTNNGLFGGSQGNDYAVTVGILFTNNTTSTFSAAVNWRDTQGSTVHGIGLTVAPGTLDGTNYILSLSHQKTYLFQFPNSTRTYVDTAPGVSSTVVSGNASTSGLLTALNSYLVSTGDDTAPVITGPSGGAGASASALSVNENQTAVTTLTANEAVTWSIPGGEDVAKFAIDPSTGVLTFLAAPDFEVPTDVGTNNTYIVQVRATDTAGNFSLQTVTVLDVADSAPTFTGMNATDGSGNPSYSFNYNENQASGATLGTVTATGGNGGALTLSISAGNASSWFAINASTGAITLTAAGAASLANDYETLANSQTLTVQVTDGALTTSIEVKLNELDVADTAPVITGPSDGAGAAASALSVNENQTAVTTLTANEPVTWSIASGGEDGARFAIDPNTGVLTFVAAPDFEVPTDGATSGTNTYVVQVRATNASGNFSLQTVTVTVVNVVDEIIANKLNQIGDKLRTSLRTYAAHGLSDMLSFNEALMGGNDDVCEDPTAREAFSGSANGNQDAGNVKLNYSDRLSQCGRRQQVFVDAGLTYSKMAGDWNSRAFAALRFETKVDDDLSLGVGVLASHSSDEMIGFEQSTISDKSLQFNLYSRYRLSKALRTGAFVGLGRTRYNFGLTDTDGFTVDGQMDGKRQVYGWMLSGDISVGGTVITADAVVSHAVEKLGSARLAAQYMGESQSGIAFAVDTVDVTRISVPVTAPIMLTGSRDGLGASSRLLLSPGLLCEDNNVESSSMRCGYQLGAKLVADDGGRSRFYADYRWESVAGLRRSLIGLGYSYRFGKSDGLELALDLNRGPTGLTGQENRALLSLRMAR